MAEEKILSRVQKLLDKANANGVTDAERQLLLDKADELMVKHGIEEAMLMAAMSKEERRKPIQDRFHASDPNAPHWEKFRTVLYYVARLYRVRSAFHYNGDVTLVGYHEDVEYVKMKFLNVYLHFSKTIDPRWDLSLTIDHNVYNFKVAGRQWQEIRNIMFSATGIDKPLHFFKPSYQRHCKLIGEEPRPHTQRNWAYRESFAESFANRICARIEELTRDRDKQASEAGALVAVKDLGIEIDDLFYSLFPQVRPMTEDELRAKREQDAAAERQHQEWLESLSPAERREYDRQQERDRRKAAKADERYWRQQDKLYDAEGAGAGRASANNVDLSRSEGVGAQTRKEL
jgi:hypothetical protein